MNNSYDYLSDKQIDDILNNEKKNLNEIDINNQRDFEKFNKNLEINKNLIENNNNFKKYSIYNNIFFY